MAPFHGRALLVRARLGPSPRHCQPWSSQRRLLTCSRRLYSQDDDFVHLNLDKTMLDSGRDLRPASHPSPQPETEEGAKKISPSPTFTSLKDRLRQKSSNRPDGTQRQTEEGTKKTSPSSKSTSLKDRLRQKSSDRPNGTQPETKDGAKKESQPNDTTETEAPSNDPFHRHVLGHYRQMPMRTRFAPSPTGDMHLGSLRTALVNQVLAKATRGGEFILRIEDTDQSRTVADSQKNIVEDLKWLDLEWSEGPDVGGPHGPYLQSQRLHIYKPHVEKLIKNGHAYRCFCSSEDLEKQKSEAHEAGQSTEYPGTCRHISPQESSERAAKAEPHVVRFRGDQFGILGFKDGIKGDFKKAKGEDDFVIWKTDGFPTYHLANVVDDHLMRITHVVRGDEWLVSTPKHLALYQALEWEPPVFAHLPLLFREDGKKLGKRDQAASVQAYKENIPESVALANWLAGISFQKHPVKSLVTIPEMSRQHNIKLLSSNTKIASDKVAHPLLDRFTTYAYSRTLADYQTLRDQRRLGTSKAQHVKEILKRYWTPAIEHIHRTTVQAEVAVLFRRGLDGDCKAELSHEPPLVESLSDLANGAVWTDSVFDYIANICMEMGRRGKKAGRAWLHNSVSSSPWLFWRPTRTMQKTWLAPSYLLGRDPIPPLRLLQMLYDSEDDNAAWGRPSTDPGPFADAIQKYSKRIGGSISTLSMTDCLGMLHEYNRLVLTGGSHSGPPGQEMLAVLGFDECRARLGMVEELCRELEAGARDLAESWRSEVGGGMLPSTAQQGAGELSGDAANSQTAMSQEGAEPNVEK